jgi:acetyltransferase-like isoleucine patch superfamily enzyme
VPLDFYILLQGWLICAFPQFNFGAREMNPLDRGYFDETELRQFGFRLLGSNVRIARTCTIVGSENVAVGSHVRIDDYCSIIAAGTGWARIGSFVHIGAYSLLAASAGIELEDFSGLSQGVRIYSSTDDYSGNHLTNPTVPEKYRGMAQGPVHLGRHVIVGSGSVILSNLSLGEGVAIGALSVVRKNVQPWSICSGSPLKKLRPRSRRLLELETALRDELGL